jgi:hypothetical protein
MFDTGLGAQMTGEERSAGRRDLANGQLPARYLRHRHDRLFFVTIVDDPDDYSPKRNVK